jgi:hypothetical protein
MTWRDKLELGLREDAAYRKDNLPPSQIRGPERPTGPGRSPEIPLAWGPDPRGKRAHGSPDTAQVSQEPSPAVRSSDAQSLI